MTRHFLPSIWTQLCVQLLSSLHLHQETTWTGYLQHNQLRSIHTELVSAQQWFGSCHWDCISTLLYLTGGGCRLCNPDNGDRRARRLQLEHPSSLWSSVSHMSPRSLLLSTLTSRTTSNVFTVAKNGIQTTFSATSTFLDYVPLLEYQLKLYLTKEIATRFGTKPGHCLFGSLLDFDVKLMEAASWQDNQCWSARAM